MVRISHGKRQPTHYTFGIEVMSSWKNGAAGISTAAPV